MCKLVYMYTQLNTFKRGKYSYQLTYNTVLLFVNANHNKTQPKFCASLSVEKAGNSNG